MLHNAHAYFASTLYIPDSPLILVGSIIPDIAITKIIGWENGLHGRENVSKFCKFVESKAPLLTGLYKGVFLHCILDDFSHNNYNGNTGYAYQNNERLSQLIYKYYEVDKETAKRIAHNYLESAVDMFLLQEHPQLGFKIKNTIQQVDINSISDPLSLYFAKNKTKFKYALVEYFELISKSNLESLKGLIAFWEDLEKNLSLQKIGVDQKIELFNLSITLVGHTYKDFINYSLKKGYKKIGF